MTKELLKSVKSASIIFQCLSDQEKEKEVEVIPADVVTIKNNKSALEKICDTLTKDFEKLMDKAEKKKGYGLFLVANSLEHKRSEKCKEISETPLEKKKKNAVVYFISCSILCCVTRSSFISSSITVFGQNFRVCYQYSKLPPVIVRYL